MREIYPYESEKIIKLKKEINLAFEKQKKLSEKFKCVREYQRLQQDIGLRDMEIERLYEEEG